MEQSSYYKFIIKFTNNSNYEHIKELFKQEGILLGGGVYEVPCHRQPVFKSIPFNFNEVINAEKYCPKHICLPITSGITEEQTTYLIKVIKKIFE